MSAFVITLRTLLALVWVLLLAAGCTADPRRRAEAALRDGGAERLRHDAARVYKDAFAGHKRVTFVEVWYKEWPVSFQELRPLHVGAYLDGISIALRADERGESGLYIVPKTMEHQPTVEHGAKYERLADGVFWYSFRGPRTDGEAVRP